MLPKNRRIQRKLFPFNIKALRLQSPLLFLSVAKNKDKEPTRFAFSISKKSISSAVKRNLCRRRGYSVISSKLLAVKPGFLCFFSFKKIKTPPDYNELEKEISSLLAEADVV